MAVAAIEARDGSTGSLALARSARGYSARPSQVEPVTVSDLETRIGKSAGGEVSSYYSVLAPFLKDALSCVESGRPRVGSLPTFDVWRAELEPNGGIVLSRSETTDWSQVVRACWRQIAGVGSADVARNTLLRNERVAAHFVEQVAVGPEVAHLSADSVLEDFTVFALKRLDGLAFNADLVKACSDDLQHFFDSDTVEVEISSALPGFWMWLETVDLRDATIIRRWNDREREARALREKPVDSTRAEYCLAVRASLGKKLKVESRTWQPTHELEAARERFESSRLALRLLKSGAIRAGETRLTPTGFDPLQFGLVGRSEPVGVLGDYVLGRDELGSLHDLIDLVIRRTALLGGGLAMTERRFSGSSQRERQEDRLVDLCIALEACLTAKNEQRGIGKRLASRIAVALGETADDRERLTEIAETAYRLRSDVVHGKATELNELRKVADQAESLVRRLILLMLGTPDFTDPGVSVRSLDRALLRGEYRPWASRPAGSGN